MDLGSKLFIKIINSTLFLCAGIVVPMLNLTLAQTAYGLQALNAPLDLVFVIDNSGSMKITDPQFVTRNAVKKFVAQLPEQSQVGLVLFDENILQLQPLHLLSDQQMKAQFYSSIDRIQFNGRYTNGPGGIERALYDFKDNGRLESRKAIVFITDGIVTNRSKIKKQELIQWLKQDLLQELKAMGIRIYGVTMAESADFELIHTVASRTGGDYFRAPHASKLSQALDKIHAHLKPKAAQKPDLGSAPALQTAAINTPRPPSIKDSTQNRSTVLTGHHWMLQLCLALITIVVAATVLVFFTKHRRPKHAPRQASPVKPLSNLPKARLEGKQTPPSKGPVAFDLKKPVIIIGRGHQSDICIPHETVSIRHASIEFKYPAFYLTDLGSTNGTRLNGKELKGHEPVRLKNDDTIWFGEFRYEFFMVDKILYNETVMLGGTSFRDPEDNTQLMIDYKESDKKSVLMTILQNHLIQIEAIGNKYKGFVHDHFSSDIRNMLVTEGEKNLNKAHLDSQCHCSQQVRDNMYYLICALPVEIKYAANWYDTTYGGFTKYLRQWISNECYTTSRCDVICVVTFGQILTPWVSVSIVPTHGEPESVEIISVDFLNPKEKKTMALDIGQNGEVR